MFYEAVSLTPSLRSSCYVLRPSRRSDFSNQNLKGVAFQQSIVRDANFKNSNREILTTHMLSRA